MEKKEFRTKSLKARLWCSGLDPVADRFTPLPSGSGLCVCSLRDFLKCSLELLSGFRVSDSVTLPCYGAGDISKAVHLTGMPVKIFLGQILVWFIATFSEDRSPLGGHTILLALSFAPFSSHVNFMQTHLLIIRQPYGQLNWVEVGSIKVAA